MTPGRMESVCGFCYTLIYDRVRWLLKHRGERKVANDFKDRLSIQQSAHEFESLSNKDYSLCFLARAQMKPELDSEFL